jgi:hypothetical protein
VIVGAIDLQHVLFECESIPFLYLHLFNLYFLLSSISPFPLLYFEVMISNKNTHANSIFYYLSAHNYKGPYIFSILYYRKWRRQARSTVCRS